MKYLPRHQLTIVNPRRKTLCPYCFERIHIGHSRFVDLDEPTDIVKPEPKGLMRLIRTTFVDHPRGARFLTARRQCPNCANLLPQNMECMDNRIVGLVGSQASGKSHFIAALIKQLERDRVLSDLGLEEVVAADERYKARYRTEYFDPLFTGKMTIPPGRSILVSGAGKLIEPIIYTLVFRHPDKPKRVRRLTLVLFDAAGEDMDEQRDIALLTRYIWNASALIFMIDPMSLASMKRMIPACYHPKGELPRADGFETMQNVVQVVRQQMGLLPGDKLPIPVAVTLTKSDLVRYAVRTDEQNTAFLNAPDYGDGSDPGQLRIVDGEVRSLLSAHGGTGILEQSDTFTAASFFAVSATGEPHDQSGSYKKVEPLRCADPLVWILQQRGVID